MSPVTPVTHVSNTVRTSLSVVPPPSLHLEVRDRRRRRRTTPPHEPPDSEVKRLRRQDEMEITPCTLTARPARPAPVACDGCMMTVLFGGPNWTMGPLKVELR